jgi:hypothetical protein
MYQYFLEERVFIVKTYWITGSIKSCQRRFVEQFGGRNLPLKRYIQILVKKLETKGTLLDLHGGERPEMSENTVHDVANRLLAPKKSLFVLSQEIGLPRSTCQSCYKKAGLHAYRFRVAQELIQQDYDKSMTYCRWFQTFIEENPGILDYTWFSDEAWFHLSGYVNSQNTHLWGSENPHHCSRNPSIPRNSACSVRYHSSE